VCIILIAGFGKYQRIFHSLFVQVMLHHIIVSIAKIATQNPEEKLKTLNSTTKTTNHLYDSSYRKYTCQSMTQAGTLSSHSHLKDSSYLI